MIVPPVAEIAGYLSHTGWERRPETWRGASVWAQGGHEVLLPGRDSLRDVELRVHELLDAVAAAEGRPSDEVLRDIASPLVDHLYYRMHPPGLPSGLTSLAAGRRALQGIEKMLAAAARAAVEGPHSRFRGRMPGEAAGVVAAAQLEPARAGSYVYGVRIPVGPHAESLPGRAAARQLHDAVAAARDATMTASRVGGDPESFDERVADGVSARLCEGLSLLAGDDGTWPFEVVFRWARAAPAEVPATELGFPAGSGATLRTAAHRLLRLEVAGDATVVGLIEGLHEGAGRRDRWRMRVRGEMTTARTVAPRRTVWVRLRSQAAYATALEARRTGARVRVAGRLAIADGRLELHPSDASFDVLD